MLKSIEDIYYRIRFGKICDIDELRQKLSGLDITLTKSDLEKLFDFQASTDFSRKSDDCDNPYKSPSELIEIPINDLTSYLRGVVIEEKPPRQVQITAEYFKEDLAHHKVDGTWRPRVLYHEKVSITVEKVPGSGTLYSGKIPRSMINQFILGLQSEN